MGACGKRAKLPGVNDLTLFVTVALASVGLSSSCVCRRLLHSIDINDRRTIISRLDPSQHPACISAVRRTTYSRRYGARRRSVKWDDSAGLTVRTVFFPSSLHSHSDSFWTAFTNIMYLYGIKWALAFVCLF